MILNFKQFGLNENKRSLIVATDMLETDLIHQDFMKKIFGGEIKKYETDTDTERGPDGLERTVWIEISDPTAESMDAVSTKYAEFAKPFEDWCKSKELYDPEILTTDNTMTFKITL